MYFFSVEIALKRKTEVALMSFRRETGRKYQSGCFMVNNYRLFCPQSNLGRGELSSFPPCRFHSAMSESWKWNSFLHCTFKEVHKMGCCLHSWCKFSPASFVLFYVFPQQHDLPRASQAQQVGSHVLLMNFNLHPIVKLGSTVLTNNTLNTLPLEDGQQSARLSERDEDVWG